MLSRNVGGRGPILTNVRWQLIQPLSKSGWSLKAFWFHGISLADPSEDKLQLWVSFSQGCSASNTAAHPEGDTLGVGWQGLGWGGRRIWPEVSRGRGGFTFAQFLPRGPWEALCCPIKPGGQRTFFYRGPANKYLRLCRRCGLCCLLVHFLEPLKNVKTILSSWDHMLQFADP